MKETLDEIEESLKKKPKKRGGDRLTGRRLPQKVLTSHNLTPEQEAYCRGRALGMSKGESAAMAGLTTTYSAQVAKWEALPAVQTRIAELVETLTQNSIIKTGLDQSWVISRLMTITERCMQAEPVLMRGEDGEMVPSGEYKFDSSGANRALELLGKTLRMFEPKPVTKESELANLSDEDITRIAAELAAETGLAATFAGTKETAGPQQVIEVQALPKAD